MTVHIENRSLHIDLHPIPPLESGCSWEQPSRSEIEIDAEYALMSRATFDALVEYTCTNPTGVLIGKMWKRHDGAFDRSYLASGGIPVWLLCWYDKSEQGPGWCSTHIRKILIS